MLKVAVGIIINAAGQVLVALRPPHVPLGGLWEFPGGKIESGESTHDALKRELNEELGILVESATPYFKSTHDYTDQIIELDIWLVNKFSGIATGAEGQQVEWIALKDLPTKQFPAANQTIITKLLAEHA